MALVDDPDKFIPDTEKLFCVYCGAEMLQEPVGRWCCDQCDTTAMIVIDGQGSRCIGFGKDKVVQNGTVIKSADHPHYFVDTSNETDMSEYYFSFPTNSGEWVMVRLGVKSWEHLTQTVFDILANSNPETPSKD